jgi:TetR/AcrR family transcriptional regulator, transcriptional repressor for nem operon
VTTLQPNERTPKKARNARGEDTRERLLQAAVDLLWLHGYGSVTIDQLCERAGVQKGSFYHFFDSKLDLTAAAVRWNWDERRQQLDRIFSASVPAIERLTNYFANAYERQIGFQKETGQVLGCLYFCLGSEVTKHENVVSSLIGDIVKQIIRYYESALRDGVADGTVKVRDPAASAVTLFSYVEGCLTQARIRNDPEVVRHMGEAALRMIGAEPATTAPV